MQKFALFVLSALLCACAAKAPKPDNAGPSWIYVGNDVELTQNIYMQVQRSDKAQHTITALFRFEFTSLHELTAGSDFKQVRYAERRDLTEIDCKHVTMRLLDETFLDTDGKQVFKVTPAADGSTARAVFAGGVSDLLYEGACGDTLDWADLGQDPQKTQEVYALVQTPGAQDVSVSARFRFVYDERRQMTAAPAMTLVSYQSRQASVLVDCANQTFNLQRETYYDENNVAVFRVTGAADAPPTSVAPNGVTGMMYRAACGIPLNWTYLGTDPKDTQKVYLLGEPAAKSGGNVEARFRFEYLASGKLVTGADLKQVEYKTRSNDVLVNCAGKTLTLLTETYQDATGKEVFRVAPAKGSQVPTPVAAQGLSGMMYKALCHS